MNFGTALESFTPPDVTPDTEKIFEMSTRAEKLGFDTVWVWDHLLLGSRKVYQVLEPLTLLSAIAAKTSKIKLGISTLVLPLRDPVVLAKEVQTIHHISGGRLLLGVAAGWYEKEFDAVGSKFSDRGKTTEEYLSLLRKLVNETDINMYSAVKSLAILSASSKVSFTHTGTMLTLVMLFSSRPAALANFSISIQVSVKSSGV